jgi:hypothetical protein
MVILKKSNQSDVEVVQVSPSEYVVKHNETETAPLSIEDLTVEVIKLKQVVRVPSKWVNDLALVTITSLMDKLKNKAE